VKLVASEYTSFSRTVPYLDRLKNNILELPGGEN
jgi:hypothetical protein